MKCALIIGYIYTNSNVPSKLLSYEQYTRVHLFVSKILEELIIFIDYALTILIVKATPSSF